MRSSALRNEELERERFLVALVRDISRDALLGSKGLSPGTPTVCRNSRVSLRYEYDKLVLTIMEG
jgi:hypothetical protein